LYKAGDPATLSALQGLFEKLPNNDPDAAAPPSPPNPTPHPSETPVPSKPTPRRKKTDTAATPQSDDPSAVPVPSKKTGRKSKKAAVGTDGVLYIPPFVHFQQTVIRDKLKSMSDEEATAVEAHIEDAYATAMKIWEQPWLAPTKAGKSGNNLENEFYMG